MGRPLARLAVAGAAVYASPGLAAVGRLRYPGVVRRLPGRADAVALTFDDGPHPEGTPAVLREIVAAGHELGLHGGRHVPHGLVPPLLLERMLERARSEIEAGAGVELGTLRAPFGAASLSTLRFARRSGMPVVGWSRWGRDWEAGATPEAIARHVAAGVAGGDILLLHDSDAYSAPGSWRRTTEALPAIAERLAEAGLGTALVAESLKRRGQSP